MDQTTIEKVMKLMEGIFLKYCVVSEEARRKCVIAILQNGKILDLARSKYDLSAAFDSAAVVNVFASGTAIVQRRRKMTVNVSVSAATRAKIVAHNPDLELEFDANQRINHSVAYVQRIVETKRSMWLLRHDNGYLTDIGGNPAFHANAGHDTVHSCILCNNDRDMGRMVLRKLKAEYSGNLDKLHYCMNGVQNCYVDSTEALSIFAVQDIDPIDLVTGLHRKGVEFLTGVFHYDPIMYESEKGFFPYVEMHYETSVAPDTGRKVVSFHFENDPSFSYEHDLERLLKYSRSWSYHVPETDFVYRYDLTSVQGGIARFTIVRQQREYLGTANNEVAYRYVNHESTYRISSWTLDFESNTDSQFTGYKPIQQDVPEDLFMFLYKFGLSNDTENPDKLFTVDQLRAQARTFNETRTLNGHVFTGRLVMSPTQLESVVVAIYVIVMYDMAVENHIATKQVTAMLDKQSLRKQKAFLSTTGKIVGVSFALPIIFAAGQMSSFYHYILALLRSGAELGDMRVSWKKFPSYMPMSSMQRYSGPGLSQSLELTGHSFAGMDKVETFVQPQKVRDLFDDVLSDQQKKKLDTLLKQPYVEDASVSSVSTTDVDASSDLSPTRSEYGTSTGSADLDWYHQDVEDYLKVKREVLWRQDTEHAEVGFEELNSHAVPAMAEHARYNFDVALSQVGASKEKCTEVYAGAPIGNKIQMYNAANDLGIKFLRVLAGKVEMSGDDSYAFGIDPQTGQWLEIHKGSDGSYVQSRTTSLLYVSRDTSILNGFKIGKGLLKLVDKSKYKGTSFHLVDAVFGAGKTHEIIHRFSYGDVIVTQTVASKEDIINKLRMRTDLKGLDFEKYVRSADSALMHGLPRTATVFIDEGLMMYPGQIFGLAVATRAERAYVFGDTAQIAPIDRSMSFGALTYQGMCRWNSVEFRDVTFRSPADVVLLLARFFKLERRALLRTASPVMRSLSLRIVTNPEDRDAFGPKPGWTIITILRVDRGALLTNPNVKDGKKCSEADVQSMQSRLFNVGEAQGSTFPRVSIRRKFCYADQLFQKSQQTVVAFSRHILQAEYVTTVPNDPYAALVRDSFSFTDSQLRAVQVETPEWLQERIDGMR